MALGPSQTGADVEAICRRHTDVRPTLISGTGVSQDKQRGAFNLTFKHRLFPGLLTLRAVE